jgi:hypothetical protein
MFEGLRILVGVVGALLLLGGLVGVVGGGAAAVPGGLWAMLLGSVGIIVAVLERRRYAADEETAPRGAPPARLEPTAEVFVDPTTGEQTRVYVDRATGRRHYQREG